MSNCACIKKKEFDILVTHKGCEYLVIQDQSTWVSGDVYNKPATFKVKIKIPSRGVEKEITLFTDKPNYLTSKDLFDSQELQCLPDDIYCFSVESCGYTLNINRAYLCRMETKLDELIYKFAEDMNASNRKIIIDTEFQLASIRINAERGNVEIAKRLFNLLKEKLKSYHCDNC